MAGTLFLLLHCRGRTCAARNLTAKAILREGCGPGMPGPYRAAKFAGHGGGII